MDKKKLNIFIVFIICIVFSLYAQKKPTFEPLTDKQTEEIHSYILQNDINNFVKNNIITIGKIDFLDIINTVSYNPIEYTRFRLSPRTNDRFSDHWYFASLFAYSTKTDHLDFGLAIGYNFNSNSLGVWHKPCSTLLLEYKDNSFMPGTDNYDALYFSLGYGDRFYFAKKRQAKISFEQSLNRHWSVKPFVLWEQIEKYILYTNHTTTNLLDNVRKYYNRAIGCNIEFFKADNPQNTTKIASRFYTFNTILRFNMSFNSENYIDNNQFFKFDCMAQKRFWLTKYSLDIKLQVAKVMGKANRFMYYSPSYKESLVSNYFGFNLLVPDYLSYKQYIQTYCQFNFGGIIMDNVPFFRTFRPNEFVNFKTLFTTKSDPYAEIGIGIDNILGFLGFEIVKTICSNTKYSISEWGYKIRCTL